MVQTFERVCIGQRKPEHGKPKQADDHVFLMLTREAKLSDEVRAAQLSRCETKEVWYALVLQQRYSWVNVAEARRFMREKGGPRLDESIPFTHKIEKIVYRLTLTME